MVIERGLGVVKILVLHTYYQQRGGEDESFEMEVALLRAYGHNVTALTYSNKKLNEISFWNRAKTTLWNQKAYEETRRVIRYSRPDIIHIHNTFPYASPAVIHAASAEGVPVVVSLRNYRLMCLNGLLYKQGKVCEACIGKLPWRGVVSRCYRDSLSASSVVAAMLTTHRVLGTWEKADYFISLTNFAMRKFVQAGLPEEKFAVKPNFVYPDPGIGDGTGGYALYVGRLSPEKGVATLLKAWAMLDGLMPLKLIGDGPLAQDVRQLTSQYSSVEWLGRRPLREVYDFMGRAAFLVFPSEWYETFGRVAIEAFAKGTPVLASNIGAVAEVTEDGRTGLRFTPGDPEDLAAKVEWLLSHPGVLAQMRKEARAEYEAKYTAERNYQMLMGIYQRAVERSKAGD